MKKALALILALAMLAALTACGKPDPNKPTKAPSETTIKETTVRHPPKPAANIDPYFFQSGWNDNLEFEDDEDREDRYEAGADIWYPMDIGPNDYTYMWFNDGPALTMIIDGEEVVDGFYDWDDDFHLVPNEGDPFRQCRGDFDIVIIDNFTIYDYLTDMYFTRGDQAEYNAIFEGETYTNYDEDSGEYFSIEFGPGGIAYVDDNGEDSWEVYWEVQSQREVHTWNDDDEFTDALYIFYNGDGTVDYLANSPLYDEDVFYYAD